MANWTFLANHARVLLCIAHDPAVKGTRRFCRNERDMAVAVAGGVA